MWGTLQLHSKSAFARERQRRGFVEYRVQKLACTASRIRVKGGVLQDVWCIMVPGIRWSPSLTAWDFRFPSARGWPTSFRKSALRRTKRYA